MLVIQRPDNGNAYLFLDGEVFVSSYNETTKTISITKLNFSLADDWEKEQIKSNIGDVLPDGYDYVIAVHSYGSHSCRKFDNLKEALDYANVYNGDNGYAYLYTNNPNVKVAPREGTTYYFKDCSKLTFPYQPKGCKILYDSCGD